MGGIEERLSALENKPAPIATVDLTPIETRLTALENKPAPVANFGPVESRLATLEAVKPIDFSGIESRLSSVESCPALTIDKSSIESRLASLETSLRSFLQDFTTTMRSRLEVAEANAAAVRKELDDMKAAAAKKVTTGGFTTATGTKNFAFPAKKKEDTTD